MTENKEQDQPKPKRRWPWITLVVILALLAIIRLALRSDFVFEYIRGQAEQIAGENLNGELRIGKMRGDLWNHIEVYDLRLTQGSDSDELATLDSVKVGYNIMSLLSSPFVVTDIDIFGLNGSLIQDQDSTWNFEKVLAQSEESEEDTTSDQFQLRVERAQIHGSQIFVNAPLLLPDSTIAVKEINMMADFELHKQGFSFGLDSLGLDVHEERFTDPIRLQTAASVDTTAIHLDHLFVAGASSIFEMMGNYNMESEEVELNALLDPLSWRAIRAYAHESPLNSDINMRLSVSGKLNDLHTQLSANAEGMENITIEAGLNIGSSNSLNSLSIMASNVDFSILLNDEGLPSFNNLESSFEGHVAFDDYQKGTLDGSLTLTDLQMEPYSMERVALKIALRENQLFTNLELNKGDGMIFTEAQVQNLWSEFPDWSVDYQIERLNPALWAADSELEGMVNGTGSLQGQGFEFGKDPIYFQLALTQTSFQEQQFNKSEASGWINNENLHLETRINSTRNTLSLNADAAWAADEPTYNFTLNTKDFDISEFIMEDTLSTQLNLSITGQGKNFDLKAMELSANMNMDSSWVNNEELEALSMNIAVHDTILFLDDVILDSRIAEGELQMRQNLIRFDDINNRLDFDFRLLDLQPIAGLAGAEILELEGSINGQVRPDNFQRLALTAHLNFQDMAYDTITVERLQGRITAIIDENPEYDIDIAINRPGFGNQRFNDIKLQTAGAFVNEILTGNYSLEFILNGENGLRHVADYHYANEALRLMTNELELVSEEGDYILEDPFEIRYANDLIQVDTLKMRGLRTGSILQLAVIQYAEQGFRGYFEGDSINLGLLQDVVLEEKYFDGMLNSSIRFDINTEDMDIVSETVLHGFVYDALELDTLHLALNIADKRVQTNFLIRKDSITILSSEFDLPFELAEPEELSDTFFNEPVSGYIQMEPLELDQFSAMLQDMGFETLNGVMTLNSTLEGTAGSPTFEGEFTFHDAILSDIPIQELFFGWNYEHDESRITLTSHLDTEIQRAFDLDGAIPLYIDFRNFEISGPNDDDVLRFAFRSDDLNLAAFSEFLDQKVARDLNGILNADILISGPVDDLSMEGFFRISEGRVRAVPNEVTFRNIGVDLALEPGKIILNRASAQSAGRFTANGEVDMKGLIPDNFNIRFEARNFRVYGTSDIDAYIGMDTRLQGDMNSPRVTGNLRMERGIIYLDDFGEPEVEEVVLDDEEDTELTENGEGGFYEDLAMEMNFTIDRNFYLRNSSDPEMDLALSGDLDLVKLKEQDIEIFGDITIPSGYATTFGKRFEIDSGTLVFSGIPENPEMNIRSVYRPRQQGGSEIEIFYTISGTVEEPEFTYSSNPEMEFQDIVSYTLFGRPFNALAGWEQGAAGRSNGNFTADLAMEVLLDRVESLASGHLGIDVLEIDNAKRGPGSGTSIKAGKFLTDRVFLSFLQELGGSESGRQVVIEYMIRRNLDLLITGSDDHRSGVDVLWRLDY
ncbi:MAG: translocation/assembly module TamB domain-containing protein [Balneolales bacterium]